MRIIEGNLVAQGLRVGIVVGRFNEFIVSKLLGGALDGLKRHGVDEDNIEIAWVPGAFEIPLVAKKMAQNDKYDAVLTTDSIEQAIERAGTKGGNKGYDAAVTAIEMANLLNNF